VSGVSGPALAERRLAGVPWEALGGLAPALDGPLLEVLGGAAAERVLDRTLRRLGPVAAPARAAVAEAVFGVGLWRRRLCVQLGLGGGDPVGGPGGAPWGTGAPPRLLLAALLRDLCGRADAARLAGLEPAALPAPRPPPDGLADRYSLPDWLAEELRRAAGPEAAALADALDRPGPIDLRPNVLRATPAAVAARLAAEGVATTPGRLVPGARRAEGRPNVYGLGAHQEGLFEVQDEGSQLLGALLEARPGEVVLDACAGAGGKTLLLAGAVGPAGRVHAADPDAERLGRLRARARRAGAEGIVVVHGPAAPPGLEVDRVLVDAPCSELGALRRGPDLRWRIDPASFAPLPALQAEILAAAAGHVRPGGRLVYATCTIREEENAQVAEGFERAHPAFRRVAPAVAAGALEPDGYVRTWPHRHGTDGFFAAVWERG
jgi:16S rRNA (cytosine967-C5)-methyltransferase